MASPRSPGYHLGNAAPEQRGRTPQNEEAHHKKAWQQALRHTRLVRFLRGLIFLSFLGVVVFVFYYFFYNYLNNNNIEAEKIEIMGQKIVMDKPHISGFKRDGNSYDIRAKKSLQDIKVPNIVELDELDMNMKTPRDGRVNIKSANGIYDSINEYLTVSGGVVVVTESGTTILMQDANMAFKTNSVKTEKPVDVKMSQGWIQAERMDMLENGQRIIFEGNVRSLFVSAQTEEKPSTTE